jgi:hypothetical protein
MTLIMAPVLPASDPVARPLYTPRDGVYCSTCGVIIVDLPATAGGGWASTGRCEDCPDSGPCVNVAAHDSGHQHAPADCGHQGWGCGYAVLPHHCERGEDNCCGCCHDD